MKKEKNKEKKCVAVVEICICPIHPSMVGDIKTGITNEGGGADICVMGQYGEIPDAVRGFLECPDGYVLHIEDDFYAVEFRLRVLAKKKKPEIVIYTPFDNLTVIEEEPVVNKIVEGNRLTVVCTESLYEDYDFPFL